MLFLAALSSTALVLPPTALSSTAVVLPPRAAVVSRPRCAQITACTAADEGLRVDESVLNNPMFIDEEALLASKPFALPPSTLINLAKRFLASRGGFGADPALLSPDFQFIAPVVGPLGKDEFVKAIGSVDIAKGFPDFQGEFYAFSVDPFEGNRVWYTARGKGTNTGPLPPFAPVATMRKLVNPPQACSLTFDETGMVVKYTIGYVMDRDVGNTGGLGGLYGVLYVSRCLTQPAAAYARVLAPAPRKQNGLTVVRTPSPLRRPSAALSRSRRRSRGRSALSTRSFARSAPSSAFSEASELLRLPGVCGSEHRLRRIRVTRRPRRTYPLQWLHRRICFWGRRMTVERDIEWTALSSHAAHGHAHHSPITNTIV